MHVHRIIALALAWIFHSGNASGMEPVRISADSKHFVLKESGARFVPWGFNYLGEQDTLLEEYWGEKWDSIAEDFREMRALGANVIRIHLQLETYMAGPDQTKPAALARLRKLLDLAQENSLYLDLTGLSCYRLARVPPWLDGLSEAERWAVHERFWRAVAETCKGHPAVFCYDLMNEPVVTEAKAGEHPWLTGELGGFHFVQRIANQPGKRTQQEVAAAWVKQMTTAIRDVDPENLITVGVIPWVQVWPGAKLDFYCPEAAKHLDFVSVHFYPQAGKVAETITALKAYEIGKPIVIEETFPLSCSLKELEQFMDGASTIADGWVAHYFGKTATEHRREPGLNNAIIADFLDFWKSKVPR
ncbi:MAG: hypothetical protein RL088_858 [Verrucomicrobiota bacterium]